MLTPTEIRTKLAQAVASPSVSEVQTPHLNEAEAPHKQNVVLQWSRTTSSDELSSFVRRNEYIIDLVENYALFWANLSRARSKGDVTRATITLCKTITKKSMVSTLVEGAFVKMCLGVFDTAVVELQGDWFLEGLDQIEDITKNYDKIKNCKLFEKFASVCRYSAMFGLFAKMGIPVKNTLWDFSQSPGAKRTLFDAPDFARALLDLLIYTLRQGRQSYLHGEVMLMFHSGETYEAWLDKAAELKLKSRYLGNPDALKREFPDFTEFNYVAELKEAIEKGNCIYKVLQQGPERRFVAKMLGEIKEIDATLLTKQSAQEFRAQPLGVFVYGFPGVGKSTVMDILFSYFGKIRGLPTESKYMYSKNSAAKYYDGFQSYMWCVVLDDVACFRAGKVMGIDESIMEIIKLINNIPYVPDQAALEDKGRTPVKAELVFATSNVEDMNIPVYYEKTAAAFRRFRFRIMPFVKPEFAKDDGMLDKDKVPTPAENMYDDLWTFKVCRAQAYASMGGDYNDPHPLEFQNITELLLWYRGEIIDHFHGQDLMMKASVSTRNVSVCLECGLPGGMCQCKVEVVLQNSCPICVGKKRCVRCRFCDCVCACAPAVRQKFNPEASERAMSRITAGQIAKARSLERDYVTMMAEDRDGEDVYQFDDEDEYDCFSEIIDKNIDKPFDSFLDRLFREFMRGAVYAVYEFECFRSLGLWFYSFPMARRFVHRHILPRFITPSTQKTIMHCMGNWVDRRLGACRLTDMLLAVLTTMAASFVFTWVVKKIYVAMTSGEKDEDGVVEETITPESPVVVETFDHQVKCVRPLAVQRCAIVGGRAPVYKYEERENVWHNDDFVLTKMDTNTVGISLANCGPDTLDRIFGSNVGRIYMKAKKNGVLDQCDQNVLCVGGNTFVINTHAIHLVDDFVEYEIVFCKTGQGVQEVLKGNFRVSTLKHLEGRDISIFQLPAMAPRKDIRKWLTPPSFNGKFNGYLMLRRKDGELRPREVMAIRKERCNEVFSGVHYNCDVFTYLLHDATEFGDCGAPLIAMSGYGPQLVGFHFGYDQIRQRGYATQLVAEDVSTFLVQADFPIMNPRAPSLSAPGYVHILGALAKKSPVRYVQQGTASVYGSLINDSRMCSSSRVQETPICKSLLTFETKDVPKFVVREGKPSMHHYIPWHKALVEMTDPVHEMDTEILRQCAESFTADILAGLTPEDFETLHPYDIGTAVNGAPGLKFVDKMKRGTSMGFPFNKSKKAFIKTVVSDRWADGVEFDEIVLERVRDCLEGYKEGNLYAPVFSAALKDEPKSFAKIAEHKTRVFTCGPADWGTVVRMYFLPFIRCVQNNTVLFESGPGTNCQSLEWEKIREYLVQHGEEQMIAGDYASFDKKMATNATMYAYKIMIDVCRASGNYTEEDLQVMWGVAMDTCFPIVNFNGDLIGFHCGNPSGQNLTVILNGIVNSLYIRYAWVKLGYLLALFKAWVALFTYGDDNAMGVSKQAPEFNHTNIQRVLGEVGIKYTMADKEAASRPYININEVSFLKRTWRWEPELDAYVAPLEWASINKMLTVHTLSRSVCAEEQIVSACESAVRESFFHGKKEFEELTKLLQLALKLNGLEPWVAKTTFPSWDELKCCFERCSKGVQIKRRRVLPLPILHAVTVQSNWSESTTWNVSVGLEEPVRQGAPRSPYLRMSQADSRKKDLAAPYGPKEQSNNRSFETKTQTQTPHQAKERTESMQSLRHAQIHRIDDRPSYTELRQLHSDYQEENPEDWDSYREFVDKFYPEEYVTYDGTQQGLRKSISQINRQKRRSVDKKKFFQLQSWRALDQDEVQLHNAAMERLLSSGAISCNQYLKLCRRDLDVEVMHHRLLSEIRARFQLQADHTTSTATLDDNAPTEESTQAINVGFVHEGRIEEKMMPTDIDRTFTQDKSGNADLYDFLSRPVPVATYTWAENSSTLMHQAIQPWFLYFNDTRIKKKLDNFAFLKCTLKVKYVINASPFYYGAIGAFYRPLSGVWNNLNSADTVAQKQVPISQRPHVWINPQEVSSSVITLPFFNNANWLRVNVASDFTDFGRLELWQFSQLRSANGATGAGVTITTYIWAEDVEVAGPTVGLALQSKKTRSRADEQWWKPSGQVSQIASKVANVAPKLEAFGSVGKYAGKTIESVANAVGSIASIFGFTNLPVITDVMPFKSLPFHTLASTEIGEPIERLTIDPKQALDLDTKLVGLDGEDEMGISYLNQKESFLCGCLWTDAYATDTLIFSSQVTPSLTATQTLTGGVRLFDTPMCYVSRLFGRWRGDIIFRFKFIRSIYHRGRVRISWDPYGNIGTDPLSTTVVYTKIIDLDVDDEIELRIPFLAAQPFLLLPTDNTTSLFSNTVAPIGGNNNIANGLITMRVLNALTAPVVGSQIDVLVFVRGAEDLEYAYPIELSQRMSSFDVQSNRTTETITDGGSAGSDDIYGSCFGERYVSLRQILHRASHIWSVKLSTPGTISTMNLISTLIVGKPEENGFDPTGWHRALGINSGSTTAYNYINRIPQTHISRMYIGWRGSQNWHFNLDSLSGSKETGHIVVNRATRVPGGVRQTNNTFDMAAITASKTAYAMVAGLNSGVGSNVLGACSGGAAMTNQHTQAGVSINLPDYNNYRFRINTSSVFNAAPYYQGEVMAVSTILPQADVSTTMLTAFTGAGPDFNLLFFMNTPDVTMYNNLPNYATSDPGNSVINTI